VAVSAGSSRTFSFSAAAGAYVGEVIVDGVHLTQAQIDAGSYTFYNVTANHSIQVLSRDPRTDITLIIDVKEGKGYVEYSINGGEFLRYTSPVILPEHANVTVRAHANDGYEFKEWRYGDAVLTTSEYAIPNIMGGVHLELYFADDGSGDLFSDGMLLWILLIIILIIVCVLIWFFLAKRKKDKEES
jgi:hypothetical protein